MKKLLTLLLVVLALAAVLVGCGEKKTVTCDGCGTTIELEAGSKIEEDWIVFCKDCEPDIISD